jgi:cytochrome P450
VREEVASVVGDGDVLPEQLEKLVYTEAVVAETLRLCPSVAHIDRRAEEEDVLSGFRIPRGASVALCPYVVQRRADLWDEPEKFEPARFLGKPPTAYFPFSLGPRTCLGRALSILEVKLFLAHIVRSLQLRVPDDYSLELDTNWTVHPKDSELLLWVQAR